MSANVRMVQGWTHRSLKEWVTSLKVLRCLGFGVPAGYWVSDFWFAGSDQLAVHVLSRRPGKQVFFSERTVVYCR